MHEEAGGGGGRRAPNAKEYETPRMRCEVVYITGIRAKTNQGTLRHSRGRAGSGHHPPPEREMWCSETLRRPLALLRRSPRELWLVYVLKILDSYGYFALSEVFTTLLTSEFGVSDVRAGAYYGAWGTAIVLYGVLTGFLVDYLGVRTSLVCSYALQTLSRLVIAFTRDRASLFATVFLLHPLASAWGAPVMTIAIKRLTSATDRTVSFGIFYAMMNVAALLSGVAIDALRLGLPHGLVGRDGDPNDAMASPVRVVVASVTQLSADLDYLVSQLSTADLEATAILREGQLQQLLRLLRGGLVPQLLVFLEGFHQLLVLDDARRLRG